MDRLAKRVKQALSHRDRKTKRVMKALSTRDSPLRQAKGKQVLVHKDRIPKTV
jgi:hypothetical protein